MKDIGEILQDRYSDDKDLTIYRPELRSIAKSIASTILLSQMLYWDKKMKKKGKTEFWKFKTPPEKQHPKYKEGQSWCEELNISREEFDAALKNIGSKYSKKITKDPTSFIWYRTDMTRCTYYQINTDTLRKALSTLYEENDDLRKVSSTRYVKCNPHVSIYTENTTENTFNNKLLRNLSDKTDKVEYNGLLCKVCGEKQFDTKHGATCKNGHGGEEGIEVKKPLAKIKIKKPLAKIIVLSPAEQILNYWKDLGGRTYLSKDAKGYKTNCNVIDSLLVDGWNHYTRVVNSEIACKKWSVTEIKNSIKAHLKILKKDISKSYFHEFVLFEQRSFKGKSKADYSPLVIAFESIPHESKTVGYLMNRFNETFLEMDVYPKVFQNVAKFLDIVVDDYSVHDAGNKNSLTRMFRAFMRQKISLAGKLDPLQYMSSEKNLREFLSANIKSFKLRKRTKKEREEWLVLKSIREGRTNNA